MKTFKAGQAVEVGERGITTVITEVRRGPKCRSVFFTFPNVGENGLHFELTSFQGGPVEVYTRNSDGIYMFRGTVKSYYPGGIDTMRQIWIAGQPSDAARASFEASASTRSYEEACQLAKKSCA